MGVSPYVGMDRFPTQGNLKGKRVRVCFDYDTAMVGGLVLRDDDDGEYRTIIQLDDGRVILASECQFQPDLPHSHESGECEGTQV